MVLPTAPAPGDLRAILINNNATKTSSPIVDLILSAQGATQMLLANTSDFTGAMWEAYITAKEWVLLDEQVGPSFGDGEKTVFVKFRDNGMNETEAHSATIELNTSPPTVGTLPILINGGALRTTNRVVTLTLDAQDAATVEIFNEDELDSLQGTIVSYNQTIQWSLSENNGPKEVFVVFIDSIGNRSSFFSDTIDLAGQAVGVPVVQEPSTGSVTTDPFITVRGVGDPESVIEIRLDGYGG